MSITANIQGGLELSDPVKLSGTATSNVFIATDKDTIVTSLSVVNQSDAAATISILRHDGTSEFAIWHQILAPQSTQIITDIPMRLYAGEKICARQTSGPLAQLDMITITPIVIRIGSYEAHTPTNIGN